MKRLFWSFDPVMSTVHPSEPWVLKLRGQVEEALRRSSQYLHDYSEVYTPYLEFLRMSVTDYVKDVSTLIRWCMCV